MMMMKVKKALLSSKETGKKTKPTLTNPTFERYIHNSIGQCTLWIDKIFYFIYSLFLNCD
jgi:hypothetical protein